MATWHVFTRTEYTQPLGLLHDVDVDDVPDLPTAVADDDTEWLEVAVVPADKVVWVIRDGDLVAGAATATSRDKAPV